jgi:hypothetical protein
MNAGPLVSVLLAYLAFSPPAFAQRSAYIHGLVLDPSQAAVPEAAITVVNQESGFRRVTQTARSNPEPTRSPCAKTVSAP